MVFLGLSKMQFTIMEGEEELKAAMNAPLEKWRVFLHPQQRALAEKKFKGPAKVLGGAGTGKTLLALACGLQKTIDEHLFRKLLVSRPIMPLGKDIGYLPGSKDEKLSHWMQPIFDNLEFVMDRLYKNSDDVDKKIRFLIESQKVQIEAITYIRGRSIPKQYLIVDEAQNLTPHEVKTIISRAGEGTKVVLTGDPYQIDNPYLDSSSNGLNFVIEKFKDHNLFGHIILNKSERSSLSALASELL